MILGDPKSGEPAQAGSGGWATLDDLLRRAAARRPDALALVDPPNRERICGGAPRRLTFAQADRMVSAIAGRLQRIGLSTDAVVAIQLPNIVENVLALLGVLRAGMVAVPVPPLWRRDDCVTALSRIGAKALITCSRIGATDHGKLAMEVAAEVFSIRSVSGFGDVPDGVVPLDDLFTAEELDPVRLLQHVRMGNPAPHLAVVTWEVTNAGLVPVGRNHSELLAGGLAAMLEARVGQDAVILASVPPASFAGVALTILPWLFAGGTLVLHHPFDEQALAAQIREHRCEFLMLPGPLIPRLSLAGLLSPADGVRTLLAVWRSPERVAGSAGWLRTEPALVDVLVFGETGLIAARRGKDGRPAPIAAGPVTAPRGMQGALQIAEIAQTAGGTLAMRGPMVPRHAFPPAAERGAAPYFKIADSGYVDTGYSCRVDPRTKAMSVTGMPAGLVNVGGYRFVTRELNDLVSRVDGAGTLAALPDAFTGYRLAGHAPDCGNVRHALAARGANPLVVRAFRDRPEPSP